MLAGLAFALLVALAIATVAVRAQNVKTRAQLRSVQHELVVFSIECGRREHGLRIAAAPKVLADKWRVISGVRSAD